MRPSRWLFHVFFASLMAVLLSGCAATVTTDYDASVDYSAFKTWAFDPDIKPQDSQSLDGARIRSALEEQLAQKALTEAQAENADLLVRYAIREVNVAERSGVGYGFGFGRSNFNWGLATAPQVTTDTKGKLLLDLIRRESGQVVWSGVSKRYLDEDQSPEYRTSLIDESVQDLLERYPPSIKK